MLAKIRLETKNMVELYPTRSMYYVKVLFQFSAVRRINIIRMESKKVLKSCLKFSISSIGIGPLKNYIPIREYMKLRRKIKSPRLAIEEKALSTVYRIFLRAFHDFTILNILSNLKDLSTVIALEPAFKNSNRPIITIIASKSLKLSLT